MKYVYNAWGNLHTHPVALTYIIHLRIKNEI